jgi:hypothetical protein
VRAAERAFESITRRQRVDVPSLNLIVVAASDKRVAVRDVSTLLLASLSADFEEARSAVLDMSKSPKWHVRFNSLLCLSAAAPKPYLKEVIRRLLFDAQSARVREMAASKAFTLRLRSLVFDLRKAAESEASEKVSKGLRFSIGMLADGYLLERLSDGQIYVVVPTETGCTAAPYSSDTIEKRGIGAIVKEIQSRASKLRGRQ